MNILIIAPESFPVSTSTGSSVEITIYQIAKRLAELHHVTILSRQSKGLYFNSIQGNLSIIRLPSSSNYLKLIITYAKSKKWDCIQVENRPRYVPIIRKHFPNTPIFLSLHSLTFMSTLSQQQKQTVFKKATAIICNSHFIRNWYTKDFPTLASKFYVIHLGVDTVRFRPPSTEETETIKQRFSLDDSFNVLYAGRIIPQKGIHTLIRSVSIVSKNYSSVKLILTGRCRNKKYYNQLCTLAQKLNVSLKVIGYIKPSSMHLVYWLADCFVCPTQFHEAFGLVNVEAMASQVPVIASDRGGINEIINHKNGILVKDYKDPYAFADAIEKLLITPSLYRSIARNGRQTVISQFSWERVAVEYHHLYSQLI